MWSRSWWGRREWQRGGGGGGGCAAAESSWEGHGGGHPPPPALPHREALCRWLARGGGGGEAPVNTVDVPVEGLAPPPPHTHWGRWTPWPPHNALTRVTGTSSEICCSSGSQSNTHPQAPPYRCRPPCFWAVLRPCVCGAGGGGGALMLWVESGGLSSSCIDPPICGGGGGLRYYAYLFRCIIVISVLYRNRLGPFGGAGRWQA